MNLQEAANALCEYSELEGTEVGEYWERLCDLARYPDQLEDAFAGALKAEILRELDHCQRYAVITTASETTTQTYKYLEWKDEEIDI